MPKFIPLEVRVRAVAAYDKGLGTEVKIAKLFGVGEASLRRWRRQLRETGTLEIGKIGGFVTPLIADDNLIVVKRLVDENNDAFLYELVDLYEEETSVRVSRSVMARALARAGITRKKRRSMPRNESPSA